MSRVPNTARRRRLWLSSFGLASWCISREGPLTTPPAVSYRRTQLVHHPGGTMPRLPTSARPRCLRPAPTGAPRWCMTPRHPHAASGRLLPVKRVGASPGGGLSHALLPRHPHAAFGRLLPVKGVGVFPGGGLFHALLPRQTYDTSVGLIHAHPVCASSLIFPCYASVQRHPTSASGILPSSHPIVTSPGMGPYYAFLPQHAYAS